jgi:hypothetical protein
MVRGMTGRDWIVCCAVALLPAVSASAQVRVMNYNYAHLGGDPASLQAVFAAAHADNSEGWAKPVDVMLFQEVTASTVATLESLVHAAAPVGATYARATFTTSGSEDSSAGAQCAFYRLETISEAVASHLDISTGAGRNADRWLFKLNGYSSAQASFYAYSMHLKASIGYEADREAGALAIRANSNAIGAGVRAMYVGDYNIYNNTEPAYLAFLATGNGQAFDGLGTGSWAGSANAWKHTQSPRLASTGLVGGGMDDRFDLHLATAQLTDGEGIAQIAGTYRALGNDGNHYDTNINAGNNTFYPADTARSNALANALHEASDHIPVLVDYQVPAVMSASLGAVPARVIQGAVASAQVFVSNSASVVVAVGADELDYSVVGSGGFTGTASGVAPLSPSSATVTLALATGSVGVFAPQALVTTASEAAQNASIPLASSFTVLSRARPSWQSNSVAQAGTQSVYIDPASTLDVDIPLYNFGFVTTQSRLDADAWSTPVGSPVQLIAALPTGIGSTPGVIRVRVNSAGLPSGLTTVNATLQTSDENIPGAGATTLSLALAITVAGPPPRPGDFNGDGIVNASDLSVLLAQWGGSGVADLDGSGTVDGIDLGTLLSNWG